MSSPQFGSRAAGAAAVIATSTALATVFGEWMSYPIPVPAGVLVLILALVILPTGELIQLVAAWINYARPENTERSPTGESDYQDTPTERDDEY